jgi:hypothetical protein
VVEFVIGGVVVVELVVEVEFVIGGVVVVLLVVLVV